MAIIIALIDKGMVTARNASVSSVGSVYAYAQDETVDGVTIDATDWLGASTLSSVTYNSTAATIAGKKATFTVTYSPGQEYQVIATASDGRKRLLTLTLKTPSSDKVDYD